MYGVLLIAFSAIAGIYLAKRGNSEDGSSDELANGGNDSGSGPAHEHDLSTRDSTASEPASSRAESDHDAAAVSGSDQSTQPANTRAGVDEPESEPEVESETVTESEDESEDEPTNQDPEVIDNGMADQE